MESLPAFRRMADTLADQANVSNRLLSLAPPPDALQAPASRGGQRQLVAATLAAGIMAAGGTPVTPEHAVELMRKVREAMDAE